LNNVLVRVVFHHLSSRLVVTRITRVLAAVFPLIRHQIPSKSNCTRKIKHATLQKCHSNA